MKVVWINKDDVDVEMDIAGWMASVSYDSTTSHEKIAKHCISAGHGTPTRPMRFIFEINEVSRAFSHEFVRHEIGVAKVQRSQRYVNEDGFGYVTPKGIMDIAILVKIPLNEIGRDGKIIYSGKIIETWLTFDDFQSIVEQMYNGFIINGAKAEDARYALTNAIFTKIHVSFDFEGLQQFLYRRCCTRAQWEIREVANEIRNQVVSALPFLDDKLGAHCKLYGYCPELPKGCGIAPNRKEFFRAYELGSKVIQDVTNNK